MRTILCLQYFRAADRARQQEIDRCLAHNLSHPALAGAVVWVEPGAPPLPEGRVPVEFRPLARRLRFADWLRLAAAERDAIVVLANADIALDTGFERLERLLSDPEVALALTRHEAATSSGEPQLAAEPHWRQDCWAIRGDAPIDADLEAAAELPLGRPGSDNRIAHVLWSHGLRLSNPALHLRALHHQQRRAGPYDRSAARLFGACCYVHPCLAPGEDSELEHHLWSRQPERSGGLSVQVETRAGEGGRQPYVAAATLAPGSETMATPFQERRALAALRERARPLGSHELAVRGPAGAAAAGAHAGGGLFLPLAALHGEGCRLTPLVPERLAGIALRLPLGRPGGGRLRLRLGTAGAGEHVLELPVGPGRAGGQLLVPPFWPPLPVAWLTLALTEGTEEAMETADGEAFAELELLVKPRPAGADSEPEPLVRWGDRFELLREPDGLLARDRFWPHARRLAGLRGDTPLAWFAQGFVPPLLEWKPDWIAERPGHAEALLHWQGAPVEAAARARHARLAPPGAAGWEAAWEAGEPLHTYLPLPWTTFLRAGALPERLLAAYASRIRAMAAVLATAGRTLRVHTVCESPDWARLEACWRELGVSDLWLCHPPAGMGEGDGIRRHAWPALAGEAAREGAPGVAIDADWASRPLLAGWRGGDGGAAALAALADEPDVRLERAGPDDPADGVAEIELLTRCRFALCPGGAEADPGRLWRALAAGAVPVFLGAPPWRPEAAWLLPDQPRLWEELGLGWPQGDLTGLAERLRTVEPLQWKARQLLGARAHRAALGRTCFGRPEPPPGPGTEG